MKRERGEWQWEEEIARALNASHLRLAKVTLSSRLFERAFTSALPNPSPFVGPLEGPRCRPSMLERALFGRRLGHQSHL